VENHDPRSLPELVSALTSDLATLVRKESELVRTEFSEKLSQTIKAAGGIAVGGILLLGALLVLLQALVIALSKIMDPLWASLIVAVVVGVIGFVLVKAGMKVLQPSSLTPDRSARQLQKDAQLVKDQVQ
jgi:hypothetical protein